MFSINAKHIDEIESYAKKVVDTGINTGSIDCNFPISFFNDEELSELAYEASFTVTDESIDNDRFDFSRVEFVKVEITKQGKFDISCFLKHSSIQLTTDSLNILDIKELVYTKNDKDNILKAIKCKPCDHVAIKL